MAATRKKTTVKKRTKKPVVRRKMPQRGAINGGGRPEKYQSREEFQAYVDDYFDQFDKTDWFGHPTVTGLALHLDMSRQGLINYENKAKYFDLVKKARQRIEVMLEVRLAAAAPAGTIFNLKNNYGWVDKTENTTTLSADESMLAAMTAARKRVEN